MYTSNELEALSMAFDSQMKQLQQDVMSDLIRRLAINGEITRAADWQINRLYELGVSKEKIESFIQKALKLSESEMVKLYTDAIESGYARNEDIYQKTGAKLISFEENTLLQQQISAIAKQTAEEMRNISQSLGFAVKNTDGTLSFKPIAEYYQDTLDNAINGIASGVFDYNTVLKRVVNEMTNSGLRTVDYASGWSNRVDVAARRAVMTGMAQLTGKVNEMNAEQLETDTYEVSWHSGARPSHQEWQGKWYTREELVSVCGLGTVTGLNGANCYHDYYPVVPGVSEPTYTAEELEELNRKENTPVKYEGKEYTKYEALQRQRRLETTMRAQRQKIRLLETGNADEDDIIAARCRYRGTSQEYTRFSKAMDLPMQRERVTVDGLGDVGVGRWKKSVDKKAESGIINKYKGKGLPIISNGEISEDTTKKVEKVTKCIMRDFPTLEHYSEYISFGKVVGGGHAINNYEPKTGLNHIILNQDSFSNVEGLLRMLDYDCEVGISYKVKGIESLVAHEMGHNAHIALAIKRAGLLYGIPLRGQNYFNFENEYLKIQRDIYIAAFDFETYDEIQNICCDQLGYMTRENPVELIAQSFGNYYYGENKSSVAQKIVNYFMKELN